MITVEVNILADPEDLLEPGLGRTGKIHGQPSCKSINK